MPEHNPDVPEQPAEDLDPENTVIIDESGKVDPGAALQPRAVEQDALVREPLEDASVAHPQSLVLDRQGPRAAIELGRAKAGDHRVRPGTHFDIKLQAIPSDHTTRGVEDVQMTDLAFRIKGPLHRQWALLALRGQYGAPAPLLEAQFQAGGPAVGRFRVHPDSVAHRRNSSPAPSDGEGL